MELNLDKTESKQTLAGFVFEIAETCQFFKDQFGQPCVTFANGSRSYTDNINGGLYRSWLRAVLDRNYGCVPSEAGLSSCIQTLEGRAAFNSTLAIETVHLRVAERESGICIDLADNTGRAILIDSSGWEVIDSCTVRFRQNLHIRPLPEPERDGSIHDIRPLLNIESDYDWILMAGYLASVLRPNGPYPVLVLNGEQGSAKSTTTKLIKMLLDPSAGINASLPRNAEEMFVLANSSHLLTFNNISHISKNMSDSVCCISTGGELVTRQFFTNKELSAIHACRPVIINGIGDFVSRPDLVDRTLQLRLPTISNHRRQTEQHLYCEFEKISGKVFGAILDGMSSAIRNIGTIPSCPLPRMADFASWAMASMPAFGFTPNDFLEAYRKNIQGAIQTTVDQSPLAVAVIRLIAENPFWGTATELVNLLYEDSNVIDRKLLPTSHSIRNELRRINPLLRHEGIFLELNPKRTDSERPLLICKSEDKKHVISVISDIVGDIGVPDDEDDANDNNR